MVLATFQHRQFFTEPQAARYRDLAEHLAFVGVFGEGSTSIPRPACAAPTSRPPDLAREWNVLVLGPHFAGGFVARDLGDEGPDEARRFDFAMTFDRELVSAPQRS